MQRGVGPAAAPSYYHFMGELTAQVRISEFFDGKTWYENERVCGMTPCHKLARFRTRLCGWETRKSFSEPVHTVGRLHRPAIRGGAAMEPPYSAVARL